MAGTIVYLWVLFNIAVMLTLFIRYYLSLDIWLRRGLNLMVWYVFLYEGVRKSILIFARPVF
jgi:hypothetical protein